LFCWNDELTRNNGSNNRAVPKVARDGFVISGAFFSVAVEEHIIGEELARQDRDLLGRSERLERLLVELNSVGVRVSHELTESARETLRLPLFYHRDVASFVRTGEVRRGEVEVAAKLRPSTKDAGALNLPEGLGVVSLSI